MNYDHLAPFYQMIEKLTMGHDLQRARTAHLERLEARQDIQRALIVGEGDGSFLLYFMKHFSDVDVTVVEASRRMVRRAQARLNRVGISSGRVTWIVSDLADCTFESDSFDLIVTLFFFDNFNTDRALVYYQQLASAARMDAYWLCADFQIPEGGWREWRARFWLKTLYLFFGIFAGLRVKNLPNYKIIFAADRIERLEVKTFCGDMLFSSLYRLR